MSGKVLVGLLIIFALVLAMLATVWPNHYLSDVVHISRFFDITLPILAAGALVKYLCSTTRK